MKYIITIVLGITLLSCTNNKEKAQTISILEDITDVNFLSKPMANTIVLKFGLDKDKWQSAMFRYGSITSVGYNQKFQYALDKQQSLLGNELERRKKVSDFKKDIAALLAKQQKENDLKYSAIWLPVLKEIKALQKDSLRFATLYIFSDLQENSNLFSVYKSKDAILLQRDIHKVKTLFLKQTTEIQNKSKNIEVFIIYQPRNLDEDVKFQKMVILYKLLFKDLEIPIEFKANI